MRISLFILIITLLSACQSSRNVMTCPDFKNSADKGISVRKAKKQYAKKKQKPEKKILEKLDLLVGNLEIEELFIKENVNTLTLSDSLCPVIILKDESILYVEVIKLENDSLTLQHCDSLKQEFKLSKDQVFKIDYEPETFDREATRQEMQEGMRFEEGYRYVGAYEEEESERKARIALIFALLSIIIWPLGLAALPLARKALLRYRDIHPDYRYGRGMAVAALVIGILTSVWTLFLLIVFMINILIWGI